MVRPPEGWIPNGRRTIPPLTVGGLTKEMALAIAIRWNIKSLKSGFDPNSVLLANWHYAIKTSRRKRQWGVLSIEVNPGMVGNGDWMPICAMDFPPHSLFCNSNQAYVERQAVRHNLDALERGEFGRWLVAIKKMEATDRIRDLLQGQRRGTALASRANGGAA